MRLSETVELEFFSMMNRIIDPQIFGEMINYMQEIFIHCSATYTQFKQTLASLQSEKIDPNLVEDFLKMLEQKGEKIK
jgi:hypothetical protein